MPTEISTPTAFTASNTTVTLTVVGVVIDVTVIVVITTTTNNLSELAMKRLVLKLYPYGLKFRELERVNGEWSWPGAPPLAAAGRGRQSGYR
jgi:hypothetical protein